MFVSFSFLCCYSLHFSGTECGQILSVASNTTLKPGGPLKWKMRLVKDTRLPLPLTEVMKITRLTSPLPDMLRLSSSRPRHGRRLALLSRPNQIPNLYNLSFALLLALLPHLLTFTTVPLPEDRLRSSPIT